MPSLLRSETVTVRHLISALVGAIIAATALVLLRPPMPPAAATERGAGLDWSRVSSRELNVASVFLAARERGVRPALDSLERLASHDPELSGMGHVLAHALGRFAIGETRDIAVLAQCREIFQAGCYHGVLEGYLATRDEVTPSLIASICEAVVKASAARLPGLECAHGLGHGILGRLDYALAPSLALCDALADADSRRECLDGLFMEYVVRGTGGVTVNVGDAAVAVHQHGGMSHDAPPRSFFRASDLAFPCDSVAAEYQPSCWSYQPNAIMTLTRNDLDKTVEQCKLAPEMSRGACYRAIGKQSMGWFGWDNDRQVQLCQHGAPEMLEECVAGGVEAYVDVAWKADEALQYCQRVPARAKMRCYREIGARIRLVNGDGRVVAMNCARAPREFVDACLGAELPRSEAQRVPGTRRSR